jgi:hypothetical protein
LPRSRTLVPVLLLASTPVFAKTTPPPDDQVPEQLIELRAELANTTREQALEQPWRFFALCDADGYPLVGNLVGKQDVYQTSMYCADVRGTKA